ncbi:hypothetical protein TrispH2_004764 [Trichoplax sp. H2]|uniref:RING-type domain-containing protein n=1 Tax=Trichoplax adhaerens TaxID=10228 RepID=B3RQX3_TRIAD|nr:hypothetical protein TRIADDRAFT_54032 [Trichoplax adhaerens]EDV26779.1 hypothetical protein TRIADDRAFT_54032 [Trichoplax adhaerens]RDD42777.1 hypothetical protein TrispH2_004764 [Trichoplax sp. H2]|eukprot:XP_002110775.1 hypothetical protein TRIADDRAFT_54032 [Trichoplax adhaerens]
MDVVNAFIGLAAANIIGLYAVNRHRTIVYSHKRKCASENDFTAINEKIDKLLVALEAHENEIVSDSHDQECVACTVAKASTTTYPCGHNYLCRRCFIKTIQVAVAQRNLPLRCVMCRSVIETLKKPAKNSNFK